MYSAQSYLTPAALMREAERLRHMAHRARRCIDLAPPGMRSDRYADRLERQALAVIALQLQQRH